MKTTKPNEPTYKVVSELREKDYPFRAGAHRKCNDRFGEEVKGSDNDSGGHGFEIAKEVPACRECYQLSIEAQKILEQEPSVW